MRRDVVGRIEVSGREDFVLVDGSLGERGTGGHGLGAWDIGLPQQRGDAGQGRNGLQ